MHLLLLLPIQVVDLLTLLLLRLLPIQEVDRLTPRLQDRQLATTVARLRILEPHLITRVVMERHRLSQGVQHHRMLLRRARLRVKVMGMVMVMVMVMAMHHPSLVVHLSTMATLHLTLHRLLLSLVQGRHSRADQEVMAEEGTDPQGMTDREAMAEEGTDPPVDRLQEASQRLEDLVCQTPVDLRSLVQIPMGKVQVDRVVMVEIIITDITTTAPLRSLVDLLLSPNRVISTHTEAARTDGRHTWCF